MKALSYATCILSLLFILQACNKPNEEPTEAEEFFGEAKCTLNAETWNGVSTAVFPLPVTPEKHSLRVFKTTTLENMSFSGFYLALGKHGLCPFDCTQDSVVYSSLSHSGGDVVLDVYYLAEQDSIENYFEITAFDKETGAVEGGFQAVFVIDSAFIQPNGTTPTGAPKTLVFKNGSFKTRLNQ